MHIEPNKDHPLPYDLSDDKVSTLVDEIEVAGNTVELQMALGAQLDITAGDSEEEKRLLKKALGGDTKKLLSPNTAFAAKAFLRTYGQHLAMDVAEARAAISNKLMELANCGDARIELKALELLGKHSDIGLFTNRSEITVNYKNAADLEDEIKKRIKRLLDINVVGSEPVGAPLEEELGPVEILPRLEEELF